MPAHMVAFAAALGFAVGCRGRDGDAEPPPAVVRQGERIVVPAASPLRRQLVFDSARISLVRTQVVATATVEADPARIVRILPPMAGRVLALHVHLGTAVRKGEALLTLDAPDFAAALGDYARAQTAYKQATNTLARQRDLADHGIAARRDVEQAETDFALANDDVRRTRARLTSLGIDPDQSTGTPALTVRSPIGGRVVELTVAPGEFHNDPNASLMSIADLGTVWLTANVQEKDLRKVTTGQDARVMVTAYPGDTIHGKVLGVGDLIDPDTRTTKVRVALPNVDGRFKPGMFGTVTFVGAPASAVTVPTAAVLQGGDTSYVFVERAAWSFERRPVSLGVTSGDRIAITAGLSGGERVVARQAVLLQ